MDPFIPQGKPTWHSRLLVLIVLLVLFGLPAVSWLYLREGVNFRMRMAHQLEPKDTLDPTLRLSLGQDTIALSELRHRVVVLWEMPSALDAAAKALLLRRADTLLHEAGRHEHFRMVLLHPSTTDPEVLDAAAHFDNWLVGDPQFDVAMLWPDTFSARVRGLVADTALVVRHYYDLKDREGWSRLVTHLAVLLPQQPKPDIVLKREKEK